MYDNNSKGISYSAGFFMLIAFTIAGSIMASLINAPIWYAMTGKDLKSLTDGVIEAKDSNALKIIQTIYAVVGFLLPTILTAFMLNRRPFQLLGFSKPIHFRETGMVVAILLVGLMVSFALSYLNKSLPLPTEWKIKADQLETDYLRQVQGMIQLNNWGDYLMALVIMALLPAVCEETLFRGGLQNFLTRSTGKPWVSIIIVSIIFSAVHFSYYGFLSRIFLGAVLGWIFHYSGKLWLSILGHFINNALAVTVLFVSIQQGRTIEESVQSNGGSWWGLLLLPLLIFLFVHFKKMTATTQSPT